MNPHIGAAMWIIAMLIGFGIHWHIGAAILAAITITAISQQLTGYQLPQPDQPRSVGEEYVESLRVEREDRALIQPSNPVQINYNPPKQITYRKPKGD